MIKTLFFLSVFFANTLCFATDLKKIELNKLKNCAYAQDSSSNRIGDLFVRGENRRWVRSDSLTKLIDSLDTESMTGYPFQLKGAVYVLPDGNLIFVSNLINEHSNDILGLTIFGFGQFQAGVDSFDLIANFGGFHLSGSKVILGTVTCNFSE
jgi:hypothetical protein